MAKSFSQTIGAAGLIAGTCIGAVTVALPVATASLGFFGCVLLFFASWLLMAWTGCLVLEVNARLGQHASFVSMAKMTLGPWAAHAALLCYGGLLYALLAAYMTGGADILITVAHLDHLRPDVVILLWSLLAVVVISFGVRLVDFCNRLLLLSLVAAFVWMVFCSATHIHVRRLVDWSGVHWQQGLQASLIIVAAFGYQVVVPTVRQFCKNNTKIIARAIWLGSFLPFMVYVLWALCVFGTLPMQGPHGLMALQALAHPARWLPLWMADGAASLYLRWGVEGFIFCAIATSFLGIAMSLYDFVRDSLARFFVNQQASFTEHAVYVLLTMLPPWLYAHIWPGGFVRALKHAGVLVVLLNIILPILMALRVRQGVLAAPNEVKQPQPYQAPGHMLSLYVALLLSLLFLGMTIWVSS